MDKLKKFIDTNRDAFDDEKLPEGHFERFEKKLPLSQPNKKIRLYRWCTAIAAVAATVMLLFTLQQHPPVNEGENRDEIKELCLYYNMQMNQVLSQMQAIYKKEQTPGASDLLKESKRILTDNFMFEETVLPTLPSSNIGLYAMTQHYNTSLESLSIMLRQMESMTNKEINQ